MKRKPPPLETRKNTRRFYPNCLRAQGLHQQGAHARTRRQGKKNPLDDSARIARGLGGSCRVHKPRVPHGPAFQQRLGLADNIANNAQLMGRPKTPKRQARRTIQSSTERPSRGGTTPASDFGPPLQPKGLAKEEHHSLLALASLQTTSLTGKPVQTPLLTPTHVSNRGCTEPLLTAPLRLAQSEPTGAN